MAGMIPWRSYGSQGGALSRRDPLSLFSNQLDALFDHFFGPLTPMGGPEEFGTNWGMDVTENDREVVLRAEVPGFEPEDIDVRVSDDTLTIQAEHRSRAREGQKEGQEGNQAKQGRQEETGGWYRSFRRTLTLPANLDTSKVEANYRHGILEVHIPRSERARPRRIEVRTEGTTGERLAAPTQQAAPARAAGQGNGAGKAAEPQREGKTPTEQAGARK